MKEGFIMSENYGEIENGDIYLNPLYGDLWIVDGVEFIKINDGYTVDIDDTCDFIKVGHVEGVINQKTEWL